MPELLQTDAVSAVDPLSLAAREMDLAERLIFQACESQVAAVSVGAAHIMRAGGKRLRPLVLILAARACGYESDERPARLGAAVELIHTATLVHDDVVDEADTRRGQDVVNRFFGNEASVLMGDYLVCRALRMIADESDVVLMRAICDVIVSMCEAEVLQIMYRGDIENTFDNYLRVIRNKTAALFSFTAMSGAQLARASGPVIDRFREFGLQLGVAFQIVDDILDLTGVEGELGKPVGADLREGKFTYPVLYGIRLARGEIRDELLDCLARPTKLSEGDVDRVVAILDTLGGFQEAYRRANEHAGAALAALNGLPDSPALDALRAVTGQVLERRV